MLVCNGRSLDFAPLSTRSDQVNGIFTVGSHCTAEPGMYCTCVRAHMYVDEGHINCLLSAKVLRLNCTYRRVINAKAQLHLLRVF